MNNVTSKFVYEMDLVSALSYNNFLEELILRHQQYPTTM